jgi:hypothetical protein
VAFDTGGKSAVESWIRPATPIEIPPPLQDVMGWTAEQCARAAVPTYPCLIDEAHVVAELYNMSNVPMAVWIDEQGRIVRPAEAAGASDGFRTMDRATFQMAPAIAATGKAARQGYIDAIRDWVARGEQSTYALPPAEVRRRVQGASATEAVAMANFHLGQYLFEQGHQQDSQKYFDRARALCPERWHLVRQALELVAVGNASGPEFFAAVDGLGDRPYYSPVEYGPARK